MFLVLSSLAAKHNKLRFLVAAVDTSLRVYLWAPKPYGNFMRFKEFKLPHKPLTLSASVVNEDELQIIFSSRIGERGLSGATGLEHVGRPGLRA